MVCPSEPPAPRRRRGLAIGIAFALGFIVSSTACPAEDPDGMDTAAGTGAVACLEGDYGNGTDGATDNVMTQWGAACSTDADCVAILGDGAVCQMKSVIYELPGGYCTKPCVLPDMDTRVVEDAMDCDPNGGIACIGQKGFFERCVTLCTDDMQCGRDGYYCRVMPMIGVEGDPKACLMPDCCEDSCE